MISGPSGVRTIQFGSPNLDIPVPADYDNIGRTELAFYRPSTAQWFIMGPSGTRVVQFGAVNLDMPIPAAYEGGGKAEIAVYRPTTAQWFILNSSGGTTVKAFGQVMVDIPVPGDYDGDGKVDYAVFRPTNGTWYIWQSTAGPKSVTLGTSADLPVPADYNGDGKTDPAVFRPSTATWYVAPSTGSPYSQPFGGANLDLPLDYAFLIVGGRMNVMSQLTGSPSGVKSLAATAGSSAPVAQTAALVTMASSAPATGTTATATTDLAGGQPTRSIQVRPSFAAQRYHHQYIAQSVNSRLRIAPRHVLHDAALAAVSSQMGSIVKTRSLASNGRLQYPG
jgi:hypothetical protein